MTRSVSSKFTFVAITLIIIGMSVTSTLQQLGVQQPVEAAKKRDNGLIPIANSGDKIYVAWDGNKTGNREI
jgi:hypothetical protein